MGRPPVSLDNTGKNPSPGLDSPPPDHIRGLLVANGGHYRRLTGQVQRGSPYSTRTSPEALAKTGRRSSMDTSRRHRPAAPPCNHRAHWSFWTPWPRCDGIRAEERPLLDLAARRRGQLRQIVQTRPLNNRGGKCTAPVWPLSSRKEAKGTCTVRLHRPRHGWNRRKVHLYAA